MSCKARVHTRDGIYEAAANVHTCAPFGHPEKVAVLKARVQMLSQADSSEDQTQSIIGANTQALSDNVKAYLPSIAAMKRGIRRLRAQLTRTRTEQPRVRDSTGMVSIGKWRAVFTI